MVLKLKLKLKLLTKNYSCQVWLPHYQKDILVLESVQKRAAAGYAIVGSTRHIIRGALHLTFASLDLVGHLPCIMTRLTISCLLFLFDLLQSTSQQICYVLF